MHANPANLYFIGYGNWTNGAKPSDSQATVNLMDALFGPARGIGGSSYFKINPAYSDTVGYAAENIALLASSTNSYSRGKQLAASDIQNILSGAITSRVLPKFCTQYCGWHTSSTMGGTDIRFALVGNPEPLPVRLRNADGEPERRQRRRRWYGLNHGARGFRSGHRSGPERLV
jgi:hypothetical protein